MSKITDLIDRNGLGYWLNSNELNGVGVEIGTHKGEYAEHLSKTWQCSRFHTCDPWTHHPGYVDGCVIDFDHGMAKVDLDKMKAAAIARLSNFKNTQVHQIHGAKLLEIFPDNFLSFVYCDGDHAYETVKAEFDLAWKKLAKGGVLGTHDCYHRHDNLQHCGVWDVVFEKSKEWGIKPHLTYCTSAWFVKP